MSGRYILGETQDGLHEIWRMPENGGYPPLAFLSGYTPPPLQGQGTSENPYLIHDAFELGTIIHYDLRSHYRLDASIDLAGIRWGTAVIPWFAGTFDGNDLTISHLTIEGEGYLGLFGKLASGAQVKDLGVVDVNVSCVASVSFYVGGLVAYNLATLDRCYTMGTVYSSGWHVGGLAGYNDSGSLTRCYSVEEVTGYGSVGGLVGSISSGTVTDCYRIGIVTGNDNVGGLVG